MSERRNRTVSYLMAGALVLTFFVTVSKALGWFYLLQRDFQIPIAGGAQLNSADDWKSEVEVLLEDTTAFWTAALAREGVAYARPDLVAAFEGPRAACGGSVDVAAPTYCSELGRVELNRIMFNGVSRQADIGLNHLAVSYAFAHLVGHHVQASLGAALVSVDGDPVEHRRRVELQADCLAGFWLRHGTVGYGSVTTYDLARAVAGVHWGPRDPDVTVAGALVEDFSLVAAESRVEWVKRGFAAERVSACDPAAA